MSTKIQHSQKQINTYIFKVPKTHDRLAYFVFGEGLPDTGGNSAYANRGRSHLSNSLESDTALSDPGGKRWVKRRGNIKQGEKSKREMGLIRTILLLLRKLTADYQELSPQRP